MSACPIDGCVATGTMWVTVYARADTATEFRWSIEVCTFHLRQLEGPPRTTSTRCHLEPPDDAIDAKVRRVLQEWKRAHPRVGDRW